VLAWSRRQADRPPNPQTSMRASTAGWRVALTAVLVAGGLVVAALWAGFLIDYPLTRSVYFTMALVHVLAEVPFLVRES